MPEWIGEIAAFIEETLSKLTKCRCFSADRLGPVHKNNLSQVFLDGDLYPDKSIEEVQELLRTIFCVPEALLEAV